MAFDPDKCYIPTVYCGNAEKKYPYVENDNLYTGKGSGYQCLQKGIGGAIARENKKNLPADSLQTIRYIGPKFEEKFREENILSTKQLIDFARKKSSAQIRALLERVLTNSNGTLNGRSFNSTLLFLYRNGNSRLPQCVDLKK